MKRRCKLIEFQGVHYLADLDYHQLFPVDDLLREVFELIDSCTEEQIITILSDRYPEQEICDCVQELNSLLERDLSRPADLPELKILAPISYSSRTRARSHILGGSVAHKELLKALSRYAQIHVTHEFEGVDNMFVIPFGPDNKLPASMIIQENYDGVLLSYVDQHEMMPLLYYLHVPVVLPVRVARGNNGRIVNGMMRWYASMRSFDAFMAFNQYTIDSYSTLLQDRSLFHIVPDGVDTEFFHPMDKEAAKHEIAELLNMPEISQKQIVGYVARFQIEKGAGVLIDIARFMPDIVFLAAGARGDLQAYDFPSNLVHIGIQPRERLPALYNAFDVFCFPGAACYETFGLVVAEAMACGTVPVVSDYDGPKYTVGDAGVVVKSSIFNREVTELGAEVSAHGFAEAITHLLVDNSKRQKMAAKARQRALEFTWDNSAKCLLRLFQKLNSRKHLNRRKTCPPIGFSVSETSDGTVRPKAVIINAAPGYNRPLVRGVYDISIEEGIALALSQNHSLREIEAVLSYLLRDPSITAEYLNRIEGFLAALL